MVRIDEVEAGEIATVVDLSADERSTTFAFRFRNAVRCDAWSRRRRDADFRRKCAVVEYERRTGSVSHQIKRRLAVLGGE